MMESFFRAVIRFRWLVIGLVLGSTVLAALPIQTLRFDNDVEAMFPFDDPILAYSRVVEERFGIRDLIMIGVLNDNADENGVFPCFRTALGALLEFSQGQAIRVEQRQVTRASSTADLQQVLECAASSLPGDRIASC